MCVCVSPVFTGYHECRVILCKGMDYPAVLPRPVMSTLPLTVPLCDPQSEKTRIEVSSVVQCLSGASNLALSPLQNTYLQLLARPSVLRNESEYLRPLMQMMAVSNLCECDEFFHLVVQIACRSSRDFTAYEVARLMPTQQGVGLTLLVCGLPLLPSL